MRTLLALCSTVFLLLGSAFAVDAAVPPLPSPVATFDVGSLHVTQYGTPARQALIFIPGLTCGPWEWSGQITHFGPQYTIYALTLPGFDGRPPIGGPLFATVTADFWQLLDERHIVKPIVIGHSLGGTLGFMLATQHPDRLGGVVALDGLPIFPLALFMQPDALRAMVARAAAQMAAMTTAQFMDYQRTVTLPGYVRSPQDVEAIAPLVAKSDPAATGRWFQEDVLLDLRPALPKAAVPIQLLVPFDAAADSQYHIPSAEAKRSFYAGIVKGAPDVTLTVIPDARHFAMYDQPQAVNSAIADFLSKVTPNK
ncbi:MAG: alpha/beta hydrolase [Candidatus Eremiobacteraeota bacterium]|nr:alpha/beta hydrolase [Candidatus Eremiobacteraeota bacterium]